MRTSLVARLWPIICCSVAFSFAAIAQAQEAVRLLDGKLKISLPSGFASDNDRATKQAIAGFKAKKGDAWGAVSRGTHGVKPEDLPEWMTKKVADYTKGLSWLPKLTWLKKEIVTIDGRPWADLRFIAPKEKAKGPRDGLMYTRVLATSYDGQLLELMLSSNTDPDPSTKDKIDQIIASVKLEE